jgi:hypothetical protein
MSHFFQGVAVVAVMALPLRAAAQQPTQAQAGAIRSACRADYPTYCASVPTGGMAALQCLQQHASSVSAPCQQALSAVGGVGGTSDAGAPPQPGAGQPMGAPPEGAATPSPAISPRQEMALLRGSCGFDFRRFCRGVQLGGGRGLACLKAYGPSLLPQCQSALLSLRRPQ